MKKSTQLVSIEDEISRSIISLLIDEPFYSHILGGVSRKITDQIPTAAVGLIGSTITLFINPGFFLDTLTSANSRIAVIKHEVLHLVFKHLFRSNIDHKDPYIFNLAADLVVNQYIGKWKLPDSAITLKTFPNLELEKHQTVEWYYDALMEAQNKGGEEGQKIKELCSVTSHSDHTLWGKSKKADKDSAGIALGKLIVDSKRRSSQKGYSSLPAYIRAIVDIEIERQQQKIDWKSAIRIFSNSSKRTYLKYTNKRISKRYGTRPGLKIKQHRKLLIALDTSLSINNKELELFFGEIHGLWRTGTEVDIIECDDEIQNRYTYKGALPTSIRGRGGTNFNPVFQYINEHRSLNYDGCIYLTDGYAEKPSVKPYCPVIWVISPEGLVGDHLWFGRITAIRE